MLMRRTSLAVALLASVTLAAPAMAVQLASVLPIAASTTDLFPGSGANLNRFGGFSDLYYNRSTNRWFALPDRGPGGGVISYDTRVSEFTLDVNPTTGAISNFAFTRTIPFKTANGSQAFNGLNPTLLSGSSATLGLSFDPEGFAIGPNGNYYVSDEYGPSVYEFAPFQNGAVTEARFVRAFTLPANVMPRTTAGALEYVANPASGRQSNRGFEGLTLNASGTKLYATLQSPLRQEGTPNGASSRNGRIYEFDLTTGQRSAEFLYQFDTIAAVNATLSNPANNFPAAEQGRFALSGITALSDTEFLVIERDSRGVGVANPVTGFDTRADDVGIKKVYKINIAGASDVQSTIVTSNTTTGGFTPVSKSLYFDIDAALTAAGQTTTEKFEGIAIGPTLANGSPLLVLGIDNDFSATQIAGNTQYDIYVRGSEIRITPIDNTSSSFAGLDPAGPNLGALPSGFSLLPTYLYSAVVPEPTTLALIAGGAVLALRRRAR
jgi:hypothetical protein